MPAKKPAKPVKAQKPKSGATLTAKEFMLRLMKHQSNVELEKIQRYFKSGAGEYSEGDKFMGVRMGQVFALAKEFKAMEPMEIEKLLENPIHEARTGAVSVMDFQARDKKTPESRRKELYDLYLNRHDCINNWDLVDRSAPHVVGGYLACKPRQVLYKLARSKNMWERRTAITATWFFIRLGDVEDTFHIAELMLKDKQDLIHKAAGGWIRAAGGKAPKRLTDFLDKHAATMPRTMLRYAIERLSKKQREHYLSLEKW
jgi:3-methyladenine DNA glycosylase AlkD